MGGGGVRVRVRVGLTLTLTRVGGGETLVGVGVRRVRVRLPKPTRALPHPLHPNPDLAALKRGTRVASYPYPTLAVPLPLTLTLRQSAGEYQLRGSPSWTHGRGPISEPVAASPVAAQRCGGRGGRCGRT